MSSSIIFEEQNETGIVLLNKPKALNALDLEMAELFYDKLNDWKNNKNIKRILIKGEGKAFCAGGDVKSVFLSSNISNLKKKFFYKEYKLNFAISEFDKAKPILLCACIPRSFFQFFLKYLTIFLVEKEFREPRLSAKYNTLILSLFRNLQTFFIFK